MAVQQARKRYRVIIKDNKTKHVLKIEEQTSTYGVFIHGLTPTQLGVPASYVVTVEYLGDKPFKTPYEKRVAAQKRNEDARKKRELEEAEKSLVLRRKRIMNQIELAFEKKGKDAVKFVTCDKCGDIATHLGLAYDNPGSRSIAPEQITGAWCGIHSGDSKSFWGKFKTTALIACSSLEFFYDGLKQLYINRPK